MTQDPGEERTGLFDKTSPFTSALYFEENLRFREMTLRRCTLYGDEAAHLHDEIEMLYVHSGAGRLVVNGVRFELAAGSLAWLFPFHAHALQCTEREKDGGPLVYTTLRYSLGMLMYLNIDRQLSQSVLALELGPPCLALPPDEAAAADALVVEMECENAEKRLHYERVLFAGILRLVNWFERAALAQIDQGLAAGRSRAWTALQYIHFHFNHNIDAAAVGAVVGLGPAELNRALRLMTGMNFQQNLALVRVRNACSMMQYEELTLTYIAAYVGCSSTAAFYRNFKAVKGCTPDEWRRREAREGEETGIPAGTPSHTRRQPSDTARALLVYVGENYRSAITAKTAAQALYLSESTVAAAAEKCFDVPFAALVRQMRLWVAAGLLAGTALPAGDVALASGFGSERSFARAFRAEYGCTPGQYRVQDG